MSLILPPFQFANCTDNLTGTPAAVLPGTNFTAGASNVDGATVAVLTAIPHDVHYLVMAIAGITTANTDNNACMDLRIDQAGGSSWRSADLISDLACGYTPLPTIGQVQATSYYHFPLYIPSGASLGVRARTNHTVDLTTGQIVMWAFGNPSRPDLWWCGTKVETAVTSQGQGVTPGTSGSFGSWTSVGTGTAFRYGAIQFAVNGADTSSLAAGYHWQIGTGSQKLAGTPTFYCSADTAERNGRLGFAMPLWCDIPQSTQLQVRGASSNATGEVYYVNIYGVY